MLEKIKWEEIPESSNVCGLYYHERFKTICVQFKGGGLYTYLGADQEMYMGLRHAPSVGKYLNNVVKALPYTRWGSEHELLAYLNAGSHLASCIRCDAIFSTTVKDCVVCDDCWADDPT